MLSTVPTHQTYQLVTSLSGPDNLGSAALQSCSNMTRQPTSLGTNLVRLDDLKSCFVCPVALAEKDAALAAAAAAAEAAREAHAQHLTEAHSKLSSAASERKALEEQHARGEQLRV